MKLQEFVITKSYTHYIKSTADILGNYLTFFIITFQEVHKKTVDFRGQVLKASALQLPIFPNISILTSPKMWSFIMHVQVNKRMTQKLGREPKLWELGVLAPAEALPKFSISVMTF